MANIMVLDADLNAIDSVADLGKVDSMKMLNAIKRLNERKREFERQGLTNDVGYKNLDRLMKALPHKTTYDAHGEARYYAIESTKGLDLHQAKRIIATNNNPQTTVREAQKKARKLLKARGVKATKENIKKQINQSGDLHEFIIKHQDAYYGVDNGRLKEAVKRKSPDVKLHLDEEAEMYDIMDEYETNRARVEATAKDWRKNQEW